MGSICGPRVGHIISDPHPLPPVGGVGDSIDRPIGLEIAVYCLFHIHFCTFDSPSFSTPLLRQQTPSSFGHPTSWPDHQLAIWPWNVE